MATRFELVLPGEDQPRLRAAGEEALGLIRRLDAQLSAHRPTSDISRINRLAGHAAVPVEPLLFELLCRARDLHRATGGAFDITVGPLLHCWGLHERSGGGVPDALALERARAQVGMELVALDERRRTVRFTRPGVAIDLGAIGKGYALEQAALTLRELGITSALLHGGTSSITTIGAPPDSSGWRIAIEYPRDSEVRRDNDEVRRGTGGARSGSDSASTGCCTAGRVRTESGGETRATTREARRRNGRDAQTPSDDQLLALVSLVDRSLAVSAVWGKAFRSGDVCFGHIFDPRLARPVQGALLAAVVCDDATAADALSTALLVLGAENHGLVSAYHPDLGALVLDHDRGGEHRIWSQGIAAHPRARAAAAANVA